MGVSSCLDAAVSVAGAAECHWCFDAGVSVDGSVYVVKKTAWMGQFAERYGCDVVSTSFTARRGKSVCEYSVAAGVQQYMFQRRLKRYWQLIFTTSAQQYAFVLPRMQKLHLVS